MKPPLTALRRRHAPRARYHQVEIRRQTDNPGIQRGKMLVILKIVYWTAVAGYLLVLLGVASGIKIHGQRDILVACLVFGLALLYLGGSSVLFLRSSSVLWRCTALALVVLAPLTVIWIALRVPYR
jgi:hypothetical protein